MADTENPGATTSTPIIPDPPAPAAPTPDAIGDVRAQLDKIKALVVEHADAMTMLHAELGKDVEAMSQDVAQLRHDVEARLSQLESRVTDALQRLGVEKAPPAPAAPALTKPANTGDAGDMVFDGSSWVPRSEPTS